MKQEEWNDDLAQGQVVIVAARWILVLSALLIALWSPGKIGELRLEIIVIILLAAANFYLHSHLLTKRALDKRVVYGASLGDLAVITAIVMAQGGFASTVYIFYYPAVLAFSVSFPRRINLLYTGAAVAAYATVALVSAPWTQEALSSIFVRALALAGVGACGSVYWLIERDRRRAASVAHDPLRVA